MVLINCIRFHHLWGKPTYQAACFMCSPKSRSWDNQNIEIQTRKYDFFIMELCLITQTKLSLILFQWFGILHIIYLWEPSILFSMSFSIAYVTTKNSGFFKFLIKYVIYLNKNITFTLAKNTNQKKNPMSKLVLHNNGKQSGIICTASKLSSPLSDPR